ncbi:hypothetical protein KQX54_003313 [Cotesia glomerata]|uniref:Ankyrin repeat protein n=1 Tax=Cotesia glomerata TaxID=32391 RepID=A0AAV7I4W3_COTGL|nr:hypothetical protein KQX54_003313 [Cotesia glomerata]
MVTRKALLRAIVSGKVREVEKVLRKRRKFSVKFSRFLVTIAVRRKKSKIARLLIKRFASLKKRKIIYSFTTPLLYASHLGDFKVVKTLVKNGVNLNGQSRNGCSALHIAVKKQHTNILKYLIRHGARADLKGRAKYNRGFTPLHYACVYNNVEYASILIKYNTDVVNPEGLDDIHPIHLSVSYNNLEVTSLLLKYIKDINLRFSESIYETRRDPVERIFGLPNEEPTLLHWAVAETELLIIKLLVDKGADVNVKTKSGITPLMIAARVNELEPLRILLEQNPSVNDIDSSGITALYYVYNVREAHESRYYFLNSPDSQYDKEKLELLINAGADIYAECSFEFNLNLKSILNLAIYFGRALAVRYLLYKTSLGSRQLDYSLIELAAFDIMAVDQGSRNNRALITNLQDDALMLQSYLTAFIENRHEVGIWATKDTLEKVTAFVSTIQTHNLDTYYRQDKQYLLRSENLFKSQLMGPNGITCWHFIVEDRERLVKLAFNKDLVAKFDFFNFNSDKRTFYYSKLFSDKFNYAMAKSATLEECIETISNLFKQVIPHDCCVYIAYCFSNEELKQLVDFYHLFL